MPRSLFTVSDSLDQNGSPSSGRMLTAHTQRGTEWLTRMSAVSSVANSEAATAYVSARRLNLSVKTRM